MPWINAAHRNGVPILGTFIVESESGNRLLEEVLESEAKILQIVTCLITVTERFCFDGWLLIIEISVPEQKIPLLQQFVKELTKQLHEKIPGGKVFWYDSVTSKGCLAWQNELNGENITFLDASDGIFINYQWDNENLENSAKFLNGDVERMTKVFIRIDVFGRGQVGKFLSCETLSKIKKYNFSIGMFAPAWTYERTLDIGLNPIVEHKNDALFQQYMERDHLFWGLIWRYLYTSGPRTLPFYTSFCMGSGKFRFDDGNAADKRPWFNLMWQEYQPSVPLGCEYHFDDGFRGGSCLKFLRNCNNLRLFITNFNCDQDIVVSYAYKFSSPHIQMNIILRILSEEEDHLIVDCGNARAPKLEFGCKSIPFLDGKNLDRVVDGLSVREEMTLPPDWSEFSDWYTRYYYLKFHPDVESIRIVDVGISITKEDKWTDEDFIKLGALHIQAGFPDDEEISIATDAQINSHDFDQ